MKTNALIKLAKGSSRELVASAFAIVLPLDVRREAMDRGKAARHVVTMGSYRRPRRNDSEYVPSGSSSRYDLRFPMETYALQRCPKVSGHEPVHPAQRSLGGFRLRKA